MKDTNKKNPFNTPEGYFEGFSDSLRGRLSKDVTSLPYTEGFSVPENYFEGVYGTVRRKLEVEETRVIPLHPYKKYYFAAASIAAVALIALLLNLNTTKKVTFEDLANSDIENYFDTNSLDFSTYEIAEVIPIDEMEISDLMSNTLNEDGILNYLDNNTDEFEELNLEYDE